MNATTKRAHDLGVCPSFGCEACQLNRLRPELEKLEAREARVLEVFGVKELRLTREINALRRKIEKLEGGS